MTILAYHHILPTELTSLPKSNRFVSIKEFEKQIEFLSNNFAVIQLNTLSEIQLDKNEQKIAITIDDGYKNFIENGFPIIEKYNLPVTIFIPTEKIGKKFFEADYDYDIEYLSENDISKISQSKLVSIQAHGHKHIRLAELTKEKQEQEIKVSKQILEEITKNEITGFCFPYGSYNNISKSILKSQNFQFACTTNTGFNIEPFELLELKRVAVNSKYSISDFTNIL